jgi:NitT/TauT family transport system permease protein
VPHYRLPGPILVVQTLIADFGSLAVSWWSTVRVTVLALLLAIVGGGGWPSSSRSRGWWR